MDVIDRIRSLKQTKNMPVLASVKRLRTRSGLSLIVPAISAAAAEDHVVSASELHYLAMVMTEGISGQALRDTAAQEAEPIVSKLKPIDKKDLVRCDLL